MWLPKINETVTTDQAIDLCRVFDLNYLVPRIKANRNMYKPWAFDGISCVDDRVLSLLLGVDKNILKYKCALPHDLAYAYGEQDNYRERVRADRRLKKDLIEQAKVKPFIAELFYRAVRIGGIEELGQSFSWGFARK